MTNPRWAFERAVLASSLPAPARHILLTLAVVADWPSGVTPAEHTPSLTRLCTITGLGRSTVARELNRSEEQGWVDRMRPAIERARREKDRTRYRLHAPSASPTAGLVPDRDQLASATQGLASPTAGPELVPQWDGASPTAGHKPDRSQTNQTAARASAAEAIVIEATGATADEARAVIALVEENDKPRSLGGFLRRLAADGDLTTRLDKIRAVRQRQDVSAVLTAARQGPPCVHGEAGGASNHPTSGEPICALCRVALRRNSA